jgi:hypothetical protein
MGGDLMGKFPQEPTADTRTAAKAMREVFVALVDEGFTRHEALTVIGVMLGTASRPDSTEGE